MRSAIFRSEFNDFPPHSCDFFRIRRLPIQNKVAHRGSPAQRDGFFKRVGTALAPMISWLRRYSAHRSGETCSMEIRNKNPHERMLFTVFSIPDDGDKCPIHKELTDRFPEIISAFCCFRDRFDVASLISDFSVDETMSRRENASSGCAHDVHSVQLLL